MANTALSALTATTALASGDLFYVVDGGASRKIDYDDVVAQIAAATKTLTNTTFDANGTGNTLSNVETADIASGSKSGADATLVTGTAGTSGNLASWNVDGDLVDSGSAPSAFATAAQGALADSAVQPGDDANTLGSGAATDGYVLTADGLGGAAWEAASGGGGTPGGSDTQVQFNDGGAFGGDSGMTFDKTAKTLTLGGGTLTASSPVLDMAQTWNNVATTFTGIKYNVTDTNSASGSLLMDLQVGGVSIFKVTKSARVEVPDNGWFGGVDADSGFQMVGGGRTMDFKRDNSVVARFGVYASFAELIGLGINGASTDIILARDAANTLAQRNSTNPQTFNLYNTYTDASNYERGFMKWNSNVLEIGTEAGVGGTVRQLKLLVNGAPNYIQGSTNQIRFFAGGAEYLNVGLATWSMKTWNNANGLKIETLVQTGNTDRNGDPIIIDCKGGSGAGTPGYISFKAAKSLASGTTGHTSVEVVRMALNTSDETVITVGSLPTSNPGPGILWNDGGTVKVGT